MWIDNTYNIPNWDIEGKVARTNLPAMTYMRGPSTVLNITNLSCSCSFCHLERSALQSSIALMTYLGFVKDHVF